MDIPGYQVEQEIRRGREYSLHRGRQQEDGRAVLLKFPCATASEQASSALARELELLRQLTIPGVIQVLDLVRTSAGTCLVLEDRRLEWLPALIRSGRPGLHAFFAIASRLCAVLGSLHERGIVHANLSPGAVLLRPAADDLEVIDFEMAVRSSAEVRIGACVPTPYMSPEQTGRISRPIDYRADFYSLGATLYEVLTGGPPFRSEDPLEIIHAHLARTPVAPSLHDAGIPEPVSRIVLRLMAKAPEDRYQSARGIAHDLENCRTQWAAGGRIAAFELGRHDVPERFLASQRLYGREQETRHLLRAFDEASEGRAALLLVSGYSGIGKTSLIHELYEPIVRQRGYFIAGKFDQVVRNIPYGALIQAFRGLIWQLLTESEDRLGRWRESLRAALGANGGVLVEVIPEVELVIGRQDPPPPLAPAEAQNRFRYVLQNFVAAIARPDHPLVLFLDDLQWVDGGTLDVLQALLSAEVRHLLVICAYRDNEPGADDLRDWAAGVAGGAARVHHVALGPLAPPDLTAFLCDTFRGTPAELEPVARVIHKKTDGNPFFVIQFLQALEQEQLIGFDRAAGRWVFRVDGIARMAMTENIIDLMSRRIRRLSGDGQAALALAACIGNTFDWPTFSVATRQPLDEAAAGLSEAMQAGLVHMTGSAAGGPARGPTYAFLHDRVQQAAYALIPDDQKKPVHLDVGRLLLAQHAGNVPEDRLFEIANHLNLGGGLVADAVERVSVARLNLAAGRKAKTSAAYQAAAAYLEAGIALLDDRHWLSEYALMFELHLEAAECQYLSGAFEQAERYFASLQRRAAAPRDLAQVQCRRIVLYENQSRWAEAVARGREALALFGLILPEAEEEKQAALEREIAATERVLDGRPIDALIDLPVMTDPDTRMVMQILTSLWAPAYISGDQRLARLLSASMVRLSLIHGNTEDSAYGYVTHAITIGPIRKDYRSAYAWGQLALSVNERFADTKRRAKIHQQFHAHVCLWCRPYAACIPHAREARRIGIEHGDFTYAGYGAMTESWPALLIARSLDQFVRDYTPTLALLERLQMPDFLAAHRVVLNWARALQGLTAGPRSLADETFDEQAFIARYDGRNAFFLTFLHAARLHLGVLLEEFDEALEAARRAREGALEGTIWPVLIDFWGGLAMAGLYDRAPAETRRAYRRQLGDTRQALEDLAGHCAENFRCPWLVLSAEIARIDGDLPGATRLADEALAWARQTANIQQEALASELSARVWVARDRPSLAAAPAANAQRCYLTWGASVKAAHLGRRYASLAAGRPEPSSPAEIPAAAPAIPETSTLDMATVIKLGHTIAVHMETGSLLEQLMKLALENAGANRGAFLLDQEGRLVVAATAADPDHVEVSASVALDDATDLAQSVVRYVHRTRQDVVVAATRPDERFAGDPYIRAGAVKSLLCVPVGRPDRPGGVLYLENTLTPHAFSPKRTEMMRVLAAQTAISLENARLYERMKDEVARRTAAEGALRAALQELRSLQERLEAENVYLQEEIQTQHNFNDIVGNSPALLDALHKVERVAPTESTVLIVGETGSGKELFARAVHSRSRRSERPLVKVNCGAIAPGLVESELFGHVKGAFTGAIDKRVGRFEVANGGTIFLDEIGELPLDAQVKLLRVLQEQEFEPVGSSRTIKVSVRVIAATNRDLERAVAEGRFRADLLYRLNVFPIQVPPLRQRGTDVELLAGFFINGLARKLGKPLQGFSVRSMQRMVEYAWPGNVRELQNVVERAAILARGPVVDVDDVLAGAGSADQQAAVILPTRVTLDEAQRAHILKVLGMTGGVVDGARGAAALLGLHANTLRSRMKKLGISAAPRRTS
jgi:predicted ATPase